MNYFILIIRCFALKLTRSFGSFGITASAYKLDTPLSPIAYPSGTVGGKCGGAEKYEVVIKSSLSSASSFMASVVIQPPF